MVSTTRTDLLLDSEYIESSSGVSVTVNKPTKYGSNPVMGDASWTWDRDISWMTVADDSGTYKMWYSGYDTSGNLHTCYATSTDGISWTRPNLGLISYGGNTNNNICVDDPSINPSVVLNPDGAADSKYIMIQEVSPSGGFNKVNLLKSSNGTSWTYIKALSRVDLVDVEGKGLLELSDGRWLIFCNYGHAAQNREISFFISDTSDFEGVWHDNAGSILESASQDDQRYGLRPFVHNGYWMAFDCDYHKTNETIHGNLMVSHDSGITWTLVSEGWLPLGSATEWDDEWAIPSHGMLHINNDWRVYYSGSPSDHSVAVPRESRCGYATIGYERIGSVGTTGNFVTDPIQPGFDLHVNTDASGGSLKVELLNANDDSILDGFSQDDFDTISSDTYDTTCQWGGIGVPINKEVKIKFYLTSATLYSYWIRS
ncbi:MAG: glycoside hydrolase family protein [Planctomycetota bacterium]